MLKAGQPLSQTQQYELLFREVAHYQRQAVASATSPKQHFSGHHARVLQLEPRDAVSLRTVSQAFEVKVAEFDREAAKIIKEARERYLTSPRGTLVAPPPPEIIALQRKKVAAVREAIALLASHLGEERFSRFDLQVKRYISSNLSQTPRVLVIE